MNDQITILRRHLRDPDSNIWDDDLLIDLWNQVQKDYFSRIRSLEDVQALPIPPRFQNSYLFDFEYGFLQGDTKYQALYQNRGEYACTSPWEAQEYVSINGDAPSSGTWCIHPWEAWEGYQADFIPPMPFPSNYHTTIGLYYNEEPLSYCDMKQIQSDDPSWRGRQGEPRNYYRINGLENQFAIYPIPVREQTDSYYDQTAINVSGDSVNQEYGIIVRRDETYQTSDLGATYEIIDSYYSLLLFFKCMPVDIQISSAFDYPEYYCKYIRQGVLAQAYSVNGDGNIPSLSQYWAGRYQVGIKATEMFIRKRSQDRDYRLSTKDRGPTRRMRHPRLPDSYPPS